jgi:SAM-dependent methyltransferase
MPDQPPKSPWDDRYASPDYFFGTTPNDFLVAASPRLLPGETLCLADGEGRNGVSLARLGHQVTSIDASQVGLQKAQVLAGENNVTLNTEVADLLTYDLGNNRWDNIISIFFHLPTQQRQAMHQRITAALKPGGRLVLEAYTPAQLLMKTGGPADADWLMTSTTLQEDFAGLTFLYILEQERDVIEGTGHTGRAAVVQLIAEKPSA